MTRPPVLTETDTWRTRLAGGGATHLSIPDRRRATKQKEVRPSPADSLKESQLAARSGPSPPRRTSPTSPMRTASLRAAARLTKPPSRGALRSGGDAAEAHMRAMAPAADD